jgi:hypothetical protein
MPDSFVVQLSKIAGTIRPVNVLNNFERRRDGLNYYFNKAGKLDSAAMILAESRQDVEEGFALLAGLSLEILLKGVVRGLNPTIPGPIAAVLRTHKLTDLVDCAGIAVSADERVVLRVLTEHIYWMSRYPAPLSEAALRAAQKLFEGQQRPLGGNLALHVPAPARAINTENYRRLWRRFADCFGEVQDAVRESAVGDSVPGR